MKVLSKTYKDLSRDQNYRYFTSILKRIKYVGLYHTILEIIEYNKKYIMLPKKIGKQGNFKYNLFVFYNYFKIIYVFPEIEKQNLLEYFPTRLQQFFLFDLDPKEEKIITFNKLLFYKKVKNEGISHPQTFGYIKNGQVFNFDDNLLSENEFEKLPEKLFVKPYEANGGIDAGVKGKNELYTLKGDLLFQEIIENHTDIIKLSDGFAFNTVRIISYIDKYGKLHFLSAIFRISNGKIVDNWGKGSINVEIDIQSGKLKGSGITKYKEVFSHYPTTGVAFDGFQLPMWDQFIELVTKASMSFKNLRIIAWDIGFGVSEPVIVEANSGCDFFHAQLFKPYYQTPLIQDLLIENHKKN